MCYVCICVLIFELYISDSNGWKVVQAKHFKVTATYD